MDEAGRELPADFYVIKESYRDILEDAEWDPDDFQRRGLRRFIDSYAGFRGAKADDVEIT
jgi:predicted nuclease of restriction endonuclease-like (RecB) superfamily